MPRKALSIMVVFVTILLGFAAVAGRRASVKTVVPSPRPAQEHQQSGSHAFQFVTLSARNDMVSGGDVLVRIEGAPGVSLAGVAVALNGTDVTGAFHPVGGSLLGLVHDMPLGDNTLVVNEPQHGTASVTLTNYPRSGPIFSGPAVYPQRTANGPSWIHGWDISLPCRGPSSKCGKQQGSRMSVRLSGLRVSTDMGSNPNQAL